MTSSKLLQFGIRKASKGWEILYRFGIEPWKVHGNRNVALGFKPFRSANEATASARQYAECSGGEFVGKVA